VRPQVAKEYAIDSPAAADARSAVASAVRSVTGAPSRATHTSVPLRSQSS
jgi:hypothetical protein